MKHIEIGEKVLRHIQLENLMMYPQRARVFCEIKLRNNEIKTIWLVDSIDRAHVKRVDITGAALPPLPGDSKYLKEKGDTILNKNSAYGLAIQSIDNSREYEDGDVKFTILARAVYKFNLGVNDAYDAELLDKFLERLYEADSLSERINELKRIEIELRQLEDNQNDNLAEQNKLKERLQDAIDKIKKESEKKQRYIRTSASLREQFLLGSQQATLLQQQIYNAPLVINGGPGTGKTTLLIHRVNFLIGEDVKVHANFPKLNTFQSQKLNEGNSWIFFSPTELLREYLKDAMTAEGLKATADQVKTWEQQRKNLWRALEFYNPETKGPFKNFADSAPLWNLSPKDLMDISHLFDSFYLEQLKKKADRLNAIKTSTFSWNKTALVLKKEFSKISVDFKGLITGLKKLNVEFSTLQKENDQKFDEIVGNLASDIQVRLQEAEKSTLTEYIQAKSRKEEEDEDEEDEEKELNEKNDAPTELLVNRLVKRMIRKIALASVDPKTQIKKDEQAVAEIIKSKITNDEVLAEIADLAMFRKYLKPLLMGSVSYVLGPFNRHFKLYRRTTLLESNILPNDVKARIKVITKKEPANSYVHQDEQDLLIYLALRLGKTFFTYDQQLVLSSQHPILKTFMQEMKAVVAVDEATDFTTTQLGCMYLMTTPGLHAITLSGDLMQQMHTSGVADWDGLQAIMPDLITGELTKSYRQTPQLIGLAKALYKARYGIEPDFQPAQTDVVNEALPLLYQNEDFEERMNWVAERILEIYQEYGHVIPNIAIFAKNDDTVRKIFQHLRHNDGLTEANIEVKDCSGESNIGSAENVRIFNIKLIKGMEFEAVFFIDVDEYANDEITM
jgi:DNA helicase IV